MSKPIAPQLTGRDRLVVARPLAARYRAGESIRDIAADIGRSYCYVRGLLVTAHGGGGASGAWWSGCASCCYAACECSEGAVVTESAYETQLRRQLYEARQETVGLRADRARLEDEVGPLRQRLAGEITRAELAEAKAAALEAEVVLLRGDGQSGCEHRNPKRLGARPGDLALLCVRCQVFPGLFTGRRP